jgi:nicotinamide mononucleotide transporter
MNALQWLLEGTIDIPQWSLFGSSVPASAILVREVVGNGFGLASAIGGMARRVWAWPVGIVGNLLLFTVFVGGILDKPQAHDLWGQAGRQVFFLAVSLYGWWRWRQSRQEREAPDAGAILPGWAGPRGWTELLLGAVVGTTVFYFVLKALDSWGPLADAWILTGSILATYGMARGWTEFWLIWIAVDVVGVPLLFKAGYYPSAVLYLVYGGFCVAGFVTWWRTRRRLIAQQATVPPREQVAAR